MLYLDTGCLLKLYFPEQNSSAIAATVGDEPLCFNALHELELTTALQLKIFRGEVSATQSAVAWTEIEADRADGVLRSVACDWPDAWREARELAATHSATTGCRSFDALHCDLARRSGLALLTTDAPARARAGGWHRGPTSVSGLTTRG